MKLLEAHVDWMKYLHALNTFEYDYQFSNIEENQRAHFAHLRFSTKVH